MSNSQIRKIVLLGAGNLATNFALTLKKRDFSILQVYNRNLRSGKKLAEKVSASYTGDLSELRNDADLYALAVSDSAIREVAENIHLDKQLLIHFSGTAELDLLEGASRNYGILYAPQTFIKNNTAGFLGIPICCEANNPETEIKLEQFARSFSDKILHINSYQRKIIHLSAIFAGNFTNFMYSIAQDMLTENNLPMDILEPIIKKTSSNSRCENIFRQQTGPAIREDHTILNSHLEFLSYRPELREVYRILSESIIKYKHNNDKL